VVIIADAEILEKIANLLGVPVADLERLIWRVHKCQVPGYIDEPHITLSEAARRTGLGVKLLRKAIRCGELPATQPGPDESAWFYVLPSDVEAWIHRCRVKPRLWKPNARLP
jgi:hypothetical protein